MYPAGFTAPGLRQFTRHSENLLHWSDREASRQAYLLSLKDGGSRQLTDAKALHSATLCLSNDEKSFVFFDGPVLQEASLGTLKPRDIYTLQDASAVPQLATLSDASLVVAEKSNITRVSSKAAAKQIAFDAPISALLARPRHPQVLVRSGKQVLLVDPAAGTRKPITIEAGENGQMSWTPSGRSFTYIHVPEDSKQLITLRENFPDDGADKLLAKTSQFESASPNADSSVFAAASRSKASPYVLILLRVTRRELTLCEHRASDPAMVQPTFAPDSQSVFFVSDRHGKPAIYRVRVEKFVEETEPV